MVTTQPKQSPANRVLNRVFSVDAFRALTMLTMIFVNDLGTLSGIPGWLEHARSDQDFLGFADVVFPCFLFILGMAIPFAIRQRLDKADSYVRISWHIIVRSVALLIMGVFTVNVPDLNARATGISSEWFQILMVSGFFLIWNQYPRREGRLRTVFIGLQVLGVGLLIFLAVVFRAGPDAQVTGLVPQWWGILGLIGWTYLTCALLYLFLHKRPALLIAAWLFFTVLCIAGHAGWLELLWSDGPHSWMLGNGAFASFGFAGILATLLLMRTQSSEKTSQLPLLFTGIGALFLLAGFLARHFFIISKIQATPTWVFLCCGIAFLAYAGIFWLVDLKKKSRWFDPIKPAGTSTLTCYLIPYVYYSVADLSGLSLLESVTTGGIGLLKSLLFSLAIIGITAVLGKISVKLKL